MGISNNFKNQIGFPLWFPIVIVVIGCLVLLILQYFRNGDSPVTTTVDILGLTRAAKENDMSKAEDLKKFCETYKNSETHTPEEKALYELANKCEVINCYGEWGEWSEAEDGKCGVVERTYKIKTPANLLGDKCPIEDNKTEKKVANADKCDYGIIAYSKAAADTSNIVLEYITDSAKECAANCTANFGNCQFITLTSGNVCQFHMPKNGVDAYALEYNSNVTTYAPPYNKDKFIKPSYPEEIIQTIEDIQNLPRPTSDIESEQFLKIEGVNVFDGDFIDEIQTADARSCQANCLSNTECNMYTYDKTESKCLLKSVVDERVTAFKDPNTDTYKLVIKLK
jgi:hypothetical protein